MRRSLLWTVLFFCTPVLMGAEAVRWGAPQGSASFKHWGLATETRAAALSGIGAAWTGRGISAQQPATIRPDPLRLSFHRMWLPDEIPGTLDRLELSGQLKGYGFSVSGEILDYGLIDGYDADGRAGGRYGAGAWRFSTGWGGENRNWSWGLRFHGGAFEIEEESSWAATTDIGVIRLFPCGIRAGAVVRHLGWATPFLRDEPTLPTELVVGGSHSGHTATEVLSWTAGVDVRRRNGEGLAVIAATEMVWRNRLALRIGYPFGEDYPGLSSGIGFRSKSVDVDYGVVSDGLTGIRHQFGLSLPL